MREEEFFQIVRITIESGKKEVYSKGYRSFKSLVQATKRLNHDARSHKNMYTFDWEKEPLYSKDE